MHVSTNAPVVRITARHGLKCPLGGGFWVWCPSEGIAEGCTEDGHPICECPAEIIVTFEGGCALVLPAGPLVDALPALLSQLRYGDPRFGGSIESEQAHRDRARRYEAALVEALDQAVEAPAGGVKGAE